MPINLSEAKTSNKLTLLNYPLITKYLNIHLVAMHFLLTFFHSPTSNSNSPWHSQRLTNSMIMVKNELLLPWTLIFPHFYTTFLHDLYLKTNTAYWTWRTAWCRETLQQYHALRQNGTTHSSLTQLEIYYWHWKH